MNSPASTAIRFKDVHAWYGESHILHGVNFEVKTGEVVSLLGRNGAGRTTSLRALMGLVGKRTGAIEINGADTVKLAPHHIARLGVGYCPEERGILTSLTCEENLMLPPAIAEGGMSVQEIYDMFPNLKTAATARAGACRAASSKCWRWRASCAPAPRFCCWTRSPRAWHRSSCKPWPG